MAADDEWYRAPALARLAEIRARQGASDEAAELRRRARALWADGEGDLELMLESGRDTVER